MRWAFAGRSITIGCAIRNVPEPRRKGLSRLQCHWPACSHGRGSGKRAAAADAPVVVVAVPLGAQIATMKSIRDQLRPGAVLIDVTVPLATAIGGRASRVLGLPAGSAAEQAAEYAPPGTQVVSAFHFLSADLLAAARPDGLVPLDCDVVACGGDAAAQEVVRGLTQGIRGARYIHAGPLACSRLVESAAALLIAINVRHKVRYAGLRISGVVD